MHGIRQHFTVLRSNGGVLDVAAVRARVSRELLFRSAVFDGAGETVAVTVGGTRAVLVAHDTAWALPEEGLRPIRLWEPPADVATLVPVEIAVVPHDGSMLAALLAAKVALTLAEAVAGVSDDVVAVHCGASGAFAPPEALAEILERFADGEVPHDVLVQYAPYYPLNEGLDDTMGMVTKGLLPFAGVEVAVAPGRALGPAEALRAAQRAVMRELVEDMPLRDGDILPARPHLGDGAVSVRLAGEWLMPDLPLAVLLGADAVVDPETLCVRKPARDLDFLPAPPRRRGFLARLLGAF